MDRRLRRAESRQGARHRGRHAPRLLVRARGPWSSVQLDDVVVTERDLPDGRAVTLSGVVTQVRAHHEGARFDSDVFLIHDGVLPADVVEVADVMTTRVEPEIYVPPLPGAEVHLAVGDDRDEALYFDQMAAAPPDRARPRRPAALSPTSSSSTGRAARTSTSPASPGWRRRPPTPRSCSTPCSTRASSAPKRPTPRR